MKFTILLSILSFFFTSASAQIAMSFDEANSQGLDFEQLDRKYPRGIGSDSVSVFQGEEDAYVKAYYGMLRDLSVFLNEQSFYWGGQVRCNNRIYFAADGSVDYYLYQFDTKISETKQKQFKELLGEFIVSYKFGMSGKKRFAQVSPVNYRDPL